MIYRMKQNAVGLANICILSTMVLVTVSTTLCMYLGVEDALKRRFAHEVSVVSYYNAMPEHPEEVDALAEASLKDSGRGTDGAQRHVEHVADRGAHGRWIFRDRHRGRHRLQY